jgi:hypothetical protein
VQSLDQARSEQEVIDSYAAVMLERLPEVVPKRELAAYPRMQRPERVGVAELKHRSIASARLRLKERIVNPGCRLMAVNVPLQSH